MKKITSLLISFVMLISLVGCTTNFVSQKGEEQHLTVLHTNDHHGHPVAFFNYPAEGQGGLPARASLVNSIRDREENVLLLDAGDFNTGRPESNFFQSEPDLIGYNYIGYDAVAIGNHEFDNDMATMQKQIKMSEFPWLCANAKKADGSLIDNVKPYIIKEMNGFKVAIFGLVTESTKETGSPKNVEDLIFEDEVEVAYKLVPELQKKADVVIALVHLGIYDNNESGSRRLAANVPGIDLIIDGHTHTKPQNSVVEINKETGFEVPIVQSQSWGLYLGRVDLTFKNGEIVDFEYGAIPVNQKSKKNDDGVITYPFIGAEIQEDAELAALLQPYVDKVSVVLDEEIGTATYPLLNDNTRKNETAIGDLVADSMLWYAKDLGIDADLAIQNGGGIRTSINSGIIKKGTVYEVLPFDNSVVVVTMTGKQLEKIFDYIGTTVGFGSYAQVAGVTYTIQTASKTVTDIMINDQPLDLAREYKVATNSYIGSGGDGYKAFKNSIDFYDSSAMQRDVLIDYIVSVGGTINTQVDERILHR